MSNKLKLLVGVKRVIDYAVKIRVKPDFTGVVKENVKMSMNPFDEIAVEQAVRFKEKGIASEIIALTVGTKSAQEQLRTALALGADRAVHVQTEHDDLEPLAVAKVFQKIVEKEKPNMVILGKQAIDNDYGITPQILASLLNWHQGLYLSQIEISSDGNTAKITREIDGGLESLELKLPCVVSCDLRLNTPRFANLPSIMKARKKPIEEIPVDKLGVDVKNRLKQLKVTEPEQKKGGQKVESVEKLVEELKRKQLI